MFGTWRWPLTGDAALMHYVCFLMQHGSVPYKDILDINLPGSYLPNWWLQWAFGPSALAWRLYDFALLAIIAVSLYFIARPYSRFAALWAACLFALIHGRDGLEQSGERDLFAAALLIAGLAMLIWTRRSGKLWTSLCFGVAAGMALTVKPTTFPFITLLLVDWLLQEPPRKEALRRVALALCGWVLPLVACAVWLMLHGSVHAFLYDSLVLARYHARFGHVSWRFLLYDSVSPLLLVVVACVVLWALRKVSELSLLVQTNDERNIKLLLWCAMTAGFVSYLAQRRAYPYQRYPFLVFLLLLLIFELERNIASQSLRRWFAAATVGWSCLVFAPISAWKATHYQGATGAVELQLEGDLRSLAASKQLISLDGEVQCLDSVSGCISALEHLQITQASGHIYDEFMFHPADNNIVIHMRRAFSLQMLSHPPKIFVVTDPLFPSGPDHYGKLARWPEFDQWLNENYTIAITRAPSASIRVMGRRVLPVGYRMYVRR